MAEATDDLALRLAVRDRQVQLLMGTGRLTDALSLADSSIALAEGSGAPGEATGGLRLSLLAYRALTLVYTGRLAEAGRAVDTALDFAREVADANARVTAHSSAVAQASATDDTGRALEHGRRAAELGERAGSAWSRMHGYRTLGLAYLAARDWSGAVDALTTALAVARESRVGRSFEAATLAFLAEACLGSKDLGPAQAYADEADEARDHTPAFFRVAVLLARARVLLAGASLDARAAVEAMLAEAEERIHRSGAVLFQPRIHEQRAALARLTDDEGTRQRELREAHRLFTEMGATARAEQVVRELA